MAKATFTVDELNAAVAYFKTMSNNYVASTQIAWSATKGDDIGEFSFTLTPTTQGVDIYDAYIVVNNMKYDCDVVFSENSITVYSNSELEGAMLVYIYTKDGGTGND